MSELVEEATNNKRHEFLRASGTVLSSVALAVSAVAAPRDPGATKQPTVIGYPDKEGVTIERVSYPAKNMDTTIVGNLFKSAASNCLGTKAASRDGRSKASQ